MHFLTQIGTLLLTPILAISSFFTAPQHLQSLQERVDQLEAQFSGESLGRAVNLVGGKTYYLAGGGISSTDSTIVLTSFKVPVSDANYQMSDFGDGANAKGYLTIEPGSATRQEFISFTGLTQNSNGTASLTGVSRGLAPVTPYTASTTYAKAHPGGSTVSISNPPQIYEALYSYIDNASSSGAVDAGTVTKGLVEVASGAEAASGAAAGSGNTTAYLGLTTSIATSSPKANSGNVIPVTGTDGRLSANFIATSTLYSTTSPNNGLATSTYIGSFPAYQIGTNFFISTTTATSTFAVPSGITKVNVRVQAGGGGGGVCSTSGTNGSGGGGGGAGGYVEGVVDVSGTTSIQYFVGAAGAHSNFGPSNWTYYMYADGGATGIEQVSGTGGAATGGNNAITGVRGSYGLNDSSTGQGLGGAGGASPFGGAGGAGSGSATNGFAATGWGSGGGGGACSGTNSVSGGTGAPGILIINW